MAKLTDEKKWADSWFRSLAPEFKLAWLYLLDNVDLAGVIELDRELAEFQIRAHVDWERFLAESGGRIRKLTSGKLWIPKAARFQIGMPGVLNPKNTFHLGIKKQLEKHGLWGVFEELFPSCCVKLCQGPSKALARPLVAPTKAHEGEGEGEGESEEIKVSQKSVILSSEVSHKRKLSRDSKSFEEVPVGPADTPETAPAVQKRSGRSLDQKANEPLSTYALPLRDGTPYRVSQRIVDALKKTYGIDDATVEKEIRKLELWLITNVRKRPPQARGFPLRIANWFSKADLMGSFLGPGGNSSPQRVTAPPGQTLGQRLAAELQAKQGAKR